MIRVLTVERVIYSLLVVVTLPAVVLLLNTPEVTPSPLVTCTPPAIKEAIQTLGSYPGSDVEGFVTLHEGRFEINGEPYPVRGINYYPADYPWRRFLTETDLETLRVELQLLHDAGFNTLRLFLWNRALFICPGSGAVPNWGVFQRLDGVILTAAEMGFRLVLTLNDMPDLDDYPLYTNPSHVQAQTRFIIERYRDEPAILAWDLRNEGDIDYGSRHGVIEAKFPRWQVLGWLGETAKLVRSMEVNQLITAGWLNDTWATAPYVDFVSFHHWSGADKLVQRIEEIRSQTDKPILLQEFGYSTAYVSDEQQAQTIETVLHQVEQQGLLGWMIWTAFDFPLDRSCWPSPCMSADNAEHYYGIWTADYHPKPAARLFIE